MEKVVGKGGGRKMEEREGEKKEGESKSVGVS